LATIIGTLVVIKNLLIFASYLATKNNKNVLGSLTKSEWRRRRRRRRQPENY